MDMRGKHNNHVCGESHPQKRVEARYEQGLRVTGNKNPMKNPATRAKVSKTKTSIIRVPKETRTCKCGTTFDCYPSSNQEYCSKRCVGKYVNAAIARSPEGRAVRSKRLKGVMKGPASPSTCAKLKEIINRPGEKQRRNKKYQKNVNRHPNYSERKVDTFIQITLPNRYMFCGDKSFWIGPNNGYKIKGHKNPDWVCINGGERKCIELLGYRHYPQFTGHSRREEERRIVEFYREYGWICLVIWDRELRGNMELLAQRLLRM